MGHSNWGLLSMSQYVRRVDGREQFRYRRSDAPRDGAQLLAMVREIEDADRISVDDPEVEE